MKNFKGYFLTDIRRLGRGYTWCIGVIGVALFLFFSLETKGFVNENVVSTYFVSTIMSGSMIIYVFCAFPYATVFSEELEHKYGRYSIIRGNLKSYVLSKSAVIYLSSIAVMLGGTLLFLLLCRTQIPWMEWAADDYGMELAGCYGSVLKAGNPLGYCMLYALHMGFLAGFLSMFSAFCSIHVNNKVLVLVMPVLMFRILVTVYIDGYNIYAFYAYVKFFANDLYNFLFIFLASAVPSFLLMIGIYVSMKKKL